MCGAKTGGLSLDGIDVAKETVVQGVVTREGEPVGSAYVRLLDRTGEFTAEVPTSATGHFRFFASPGEWTLRTLAPKADPLDPQTRFIEPTKRKPYRLLNDSEQELYQRLCEAMPNMRVFAQVGVSQLALARGRHEAQRLNRMAGRGVDFVVCDHDFSIVAAIELVWPTAVPDGDNAEDVKRVALQSLGIPLIVFSPNKLPDVDGIGRAIADAILRRKHLESERG